MAEIRLVKMLHYKMFKYHLRKYLLNSKWNGEEWGNKCGFNSDYNVSKFILSKLKPEFGFFTTDILCQI